MAVYKAKFLSAGNNVKRVLKGEVHVQATYTDTCCMDDKARNPS